MAAIADTWVLGYHIVVITSAIALAVALAVASFVKVMGFVLTLAFIIASIKDDFVAGIITTGIVGVEARIADAAEEVEHLVIVRIGFESWKRLGLIVNLVGGQEDLLY